MISSKKEKKGNISIKINKVKKAKKVKLQSDKSIKQDVELLDIKNLYNDENDFLYPTLDDINFNIKIAEKEEFHQSQYDDRFQNKKTGTDVDIEAEADKLCNAEFSLAPQQLFVRNFLSFQTPYNSLLLYHGLGTGKTCSAIGVAEEMRDYLKRIGTKPKTQKIIIVASPNVQKNFRLQLFDERKLEQKNGIWNIHNCVGNKFLKEMNQDINPEYIKNIPKKTIVKQIDNMIQNSYLFIGYGQLANWIAKLSDVSKIQNKKERATIIKNKIQKVFNDRLVIIDEIHNIRSADTKTNKVLTVELEKLVSNANNLRLLLLSATPMFNSYSEIVWLVNLMNKNDKRSTMDIKSVFNE